jgi:hypothetical protein
MTSGRKAVRSGENWSTIGKRSINETGFSTIETWNYWYIHEPAYLGSIFAILVFIFVEGQIKSPAPDVAETASEKGKRFSSKRLAVLADRRKLPIGGASWN